MLLIGLPVHGAGTPPTFDEQWVASSGPEVKSAPTLASADESQPEIVVQARPRNIAGDPIAAVNAKSFAVTEKVDNAVFGPVALAYSRTMPKPVRSGLRNFLSNLHEPVVFVNYLIQLKPGKAAETVGRFALNTTIGVAGLIDMARRRPFSLPHRANGFANTLGYYGVKPGPFLYLPLIGATTVRDLFGTIADGSIMPVIGDNPFASPTFAAPASTLRTLDHRAEIDGRLQAIRDTGDHYAASRQRYLEMRQAEIDALHGKKPRASTPEEATPQPANAHSPTSTR